uniref:Uncharacterized protein n=1 Tax=Globodera rostochiensis TaxID=31243 RepID=A0A914GYB5_GLORO
MHSKHRRPATPTTASGGRNTFCIFCCPTPAKNAFCIGFSECVAKPCRRAQPQLTPKGTKDYQTAAPIRAIPALPIPLGGRTPTMRWLLYSPAIPALPIPLGGRTPTMRWLLYSPAIPALPTPLGGRMRFLSSPFPAPWFSA